MKALNLLLLFCLFGLTGMLGAHLMIDREHKDVVRGCMLSFQAGYHAAEQSARQSNGRGQYVMDSLIFHRELFGED